MRLWHRRTCATFDGHRHAAQNDDLVAPVELVSLARRKRQWHISRRRLPRVLPAPAPGVAPNGVVAAVVAQRPQFFEYPDQCQPLARRALHVRGQQPVDLGLPAAQLGAGLNLPLIGE